jgi:hypothetical protein
MWDEVIAHEPAKSMFLDRHPTAPPHQTVPTSVLLRDGYYVTTTVDMEGATLLLDSASPRQLSGSTWTAVYQKNPQMLLPRCTVAFGPTTLIRALEHVTSPTEWARTIATHISAADRVRYVDLQKRGCLQTALAAVDHIQQANVNAMLALTPATFALPPSKGDVLVMRGALLDAMPADLVCRMTSTGFVVHYGPLRKPTDDRITAINAKALANRLGAPSTLGTDFSRWRELTDMVRTI